MKLRSILKLPMIATSVLMFCGSLSVVSPALAQHGQACSTETIEGDYGYVATGVLLPAPNISLEFRSVGMTHFDGDGKVTWVEQTIVGGVACRLVRPGRLPPEPTP